MGGHSGSGSGPAPGAAPTVFPTPEDSADAITTIYVPVVMPQAEEAPPQPQNAGPLVEPPTELYGLGITFGPPAGN
ncbi:hypothetical protein PV08_11345 [Exophiala spinifera]|uniref:Uncharacterized protein n=1 Tax=Exophiala spinifera TaxID=91928 RepID=A0A0D2AUH8_9EURO|nr:uncharacterized protein PV08_11345 [Exophiala spinifera]KIW10383.1 hypothetical protein PV08_11345 [Exophiala spinifera]